MGWVPGCTREFQKLALVRSEPNTREYYSAPLSTVTLGPAVDTCRPAFWAVPGKNRRCQQGRLAEGSSELLLNQELAIFRKGKFPFG